MTSADDLATRQARLAAVNAKVARLRLRFDQAMSAYRWEEAREVGQRIGVLEREQEGLAAALPPPEPEPTGVVPRLARPRRLSRRR